MGSADLLTMNHKQILVLDRMDSDLGYPFRDIASDCGMKENEARSIVRKFHCLGMTGYGPLFTDYGPGIGGKGYWLAEYGRNLQRQMREMMGQRALWNMRDAALAGQEDSGG